MTASFTNAYAYRTFADNVRAVSRYHHSQQQIDFLNTLWETSALRRQVISDSQELWRAQSGCATEHVPYEGQEWLLVERREPYVAARMKPQRHAASEGRVNSKGIACLYLATDMKTAMSEIRPWLDSPISIASFKLRRPVQLVKFHGNEGLPHFLIPREPSAKEIEDAVWLSVDQAFSEPVAGNPAVAEYAPTQVIAEFFKSKGLDGVSYQSRFCSGTNVALFDLDMADLVSCALSSAHAVDYHFNNLQQGYTVPSKFIESSSGH